MCQSHNKQINFDLFLKFSKIAVFTYLLKNYHLKEPPEFKPQINTIRSNK